MSTKDLDLDLGKNMNTSEYNNSINKHKPNMPNTTEPPIGDGIINNIKESVKLFGNRSLQQYISDSSDNWASLNSFFENYNIQSSDNEKNTFFMNQDNYNIMNNIFSCKTSGVLKALMIDNADKYQQMLMYFFTNYEKLKTQLSSGDLVGGRNHLKNSKTKKLSKNSKTKKTLIK